jgi:hypothetical protein
MNLVKTLIIHMHGLTTYMKISRIEKRVLEVLIHM